MLYICNVIIYIYSHIFKKMKEKYSDFKLQKIYHSNIWWWIFLE